MNEDTKFELKATGRWIAVFLGGEYVGAIHYGRNFFVAYVGTDYKGVYLVPPSESGLKDLFNDSWTSAQIENHMKVAQDRIRDAIIPASSEPFDIKETGRWIEVFLKGEYVGEIRYGPNFFKAFVGDEYKFAYDQKGIDAMNPIDTFWTDAEIEKHMKISLDRIREALEMTDEQVEAVARAIFDAGEVTEADKAERWDRVFEDTRDWHRMVARAAIEAYEATKGGTKSGTRVTVSDVQGPFSLGEIIEMTNPPKAGETYTVIPDGTEKQP